MFDFQLFRIKVFPSKQKHLFEEPRKLQEILKETILSLPSAEIRKNIVWHIGNIDQIDTSAIYFRVGRIGKARLELFRDTNFIDKEFEVAPYTHTLLDIQLELIAIAKKSKLAIKTSGIANNLAKLLNKSELSSRYDAHFEIFEINDPDDFITHIHKSLAVSKYWVSFTRPNAFDVNKDFLQPAEKLLEESEGDKGQILLQGDSLKADTLEELTRSAAATGNDASALLLMPEESVKVRKRLRGNPIVIMQEEITDEEDKKSLLIKIRHRYRKVREGEDN
ncbi:MAG: hypothetical protein P8X65_12795 [Syntrophobacterales bacterium]|jgi:hypothetical protein